MPDEDKDVTTETTTAATEERDEQSITPDPENPESETTPPDKGDEPGAETQPETPEEKAHRLEVENAHLKGQLEASKPDAKPGDKPEEDETAKLDKEIAAIDEKLESPELNPDDYEETEVQLKAQREQTRLERERRKLVEKRSAAIDARREREAEDARATAAMDKIRSKALKDAELPQSSANEFTTRLNAKLHAEGFGDDDYVPPGFLRWAAESVAGRMKAERAKGGNGNGHGDEGRPAASERSGVPGRRGFFGTLPAQMTPEEYDEAIRKAENEGRL